MKLITLLLFFVVLSKEPSQKYCKYQALTADSTTYTIYSLDFSKEKGDTFWINP